MNTEPTKITPRLRGPKPLPSAPVGIESIDAANELASNPKALELSMKLVSVEGERDYWKRLAGERDDRIGEVAAQAKGNLAAHKRTIEQLTSERTKLNEELAEVKGLAKSRQETLQGRNQEIQKLKTSDLAFRAAIWGAIETLTAGSCKTDATDPRFLGIDYP